MAFLRWFRRTKPKPLPLPSDGGIYFTSLNSNQVTRVPYLLAHDGAEQNRLEFQHFFLKGILQTNYLVSLDAPTAILDVGSGTGRWVIEMAQEFPRTRITGIDIAPIPVHTMPSNAQFVQQDILKGLPFPSDSFDYVHARLLVAAIPVTVWPTLLREYIRVTRPGGWIELFEGGTTFLNQGPHTQEFLSWWEQVSKKRGIDASLMGQLPGLMQDAQLQNVLGRLLHVPVGKWGGRPGQMLLTNLVSGWGGLQPVFAEQASVSAERFQQTFQALPQEWETYQSRYEYVSAIGQVPEALP